MISYKVVEMRPERGLATVIIEPNISGRGEPTSPRPDMLKRPQAAIGIVVLFWTCTYSLGKEIRVGLRARHQLGLVAFPVASDLLVTQSLDGVEVPRLARRVEAEEYTHCSRECEGEDYRVDLNDGRPVAGSRDSDRSSHSDQNSDEAADE